MCVCGSCPLYAIPATGVWGNYLHGVDDDYGDGDGDGGARVMVLMIIAVQASSALCRLKSHVEMDKMAMVK